MIKKGVCIFVAFVLLFSMTSFAQTNVSQDKVTKIHQIGGLQTVELMQYDDSDFIEGLPMLDAPQNLVWNVDENGEKHNGFVSWDVVENCEGEYYVELYRDGENIWSTHWSGLYDSGSGRISVDFVNANEFNISGAYTFSIKACGDGENYNNSDVSYSDVYNFVAPTQKLKIPDNIFWAEDGVIKHKAVPNTSWYSYIIYNKYMYKVGNIYGLPDNTVDGYMSMDIKEYLLEISSWESDFTAAYVTVTALSDDIELYMNSDESVLSPKYDILMQQVSAGNVVNKAMEKLYNDEATAQDTLNTILTEMNLENISNTDLALSMNANSGLIDKFSELEDLLCEETGIEVFVENSESDSSYLEDKGINPENISLVGAALNSDNGKDVSITFGKADDSLYVDELFYKNCVAVEINIDGVKNSGDLDVPIQITMPVPTGVLSERFVILHYRADGKIERIHPAIKYENGIPYASFILTSFSPFVFCNENISFTYDDLYKDVTILSDEEMENVSLIVAAYNNDNQLVSLESKYIPYICIGETFEHLYDLDTSKANKIKIMMWESDITSLKPCTDVTTIDLY